MYEESKVRITDIRRKFLELQDCLEVRNLLERIPSCEAKDTLLSSIEKVLNPANNVSSKPSFGSLEPLVKVKENPVTEDSDDRWSSDDKSPGRKPLGVGRMPWFWIIFVPAAILLLILRSL